MTGKNIGFVGKETRIAIEGYPRSGNTYAYAAFLLAQDGIEPRAIAHHVHGLSQIKLALRNNIPVMVLIRNPVEVIPSLLIRTNCLSPIRACLDYLFFYRYVLKVADRIHLVEFNEVVNNVSGVVETLNARFSSAFNLPRKDDSFDAMVDAYVAELDRQDQGNSRVNPLSVGAPDPARQRLKAQLKEVLFEEPVAPYLEQCRTLYRQLLSKTESETVIDGAPSVYSTMSKGGVAGT